LLRPFPSQDLVAHRVSRRVNAVANDDLSLIEPIEGDAAPDGEAEAQARQPRLL